MRIGLLLLLLTAVQAQIRPPLVVQETECKVEYDSEHWTIAKPGEKGFTLPKQVVVITGTAGCDFTKKPPPVPSDLSTKNLKVLNRYEAIVEPTERLQGQPKK